MTAALSIPTEALAELPTPCLVVDVGAVDRNIAAAEAIAQRGDIALRPHFKAHRCTTLLARQLASGVPSGVTCQTVGEAIVLARAGVPDILVANQVVTERDLAAIATILETARLIVAVDHIDHVERLRRAARSVARPLGVVIELDVGTGRCGLGPDRPELLGIADAVRASDGLELVGIHAYEGHASHKEDRSVRETLVWQVREQVRHEVARLESAGHTVGLVTGGGTGTLDLVASLRSHGEAQPGSYVLMDATYSRLDLPFEPALVCLASVISRADPRRLVLDAGLKALSAEYGMPVPLMPGMRVLRLADEHAVASVDPGLSLRIGDRVLLQPAHVDPTVNLHARLNAWDGTGWHVWPVDGRPT